MALSVRQNQRRYKAVVTVTAGVPIFMASAPLFADRVLIQMLSGGGGKGYVYDDCAGMTPAQALAGDQPVELAAATADAPGGTYQDAGHIDLSGIAIGGTQDGDLILVNAHLKI